MTEEAPLKSFASNRRAAECAARRARYLLNSFLFSVSGGPRSAKGLRRSRVASNAFRHLNPAAWASSPIASYLTRRLRNAARFAAPSPRNSRRSARTGPHLRRRPSP